MRGSRHQPQFYWRVYEFAATVGVVEVGERTAKYDVADW